MVKILDILSLQNFLRASSAEQGHACMTAPGNAAAAVGKIEAALKCGKVTRLCVTVECKLVSATAQVVAMAIRGDLQLTHRLNCHSRLES